MTRKYSDEYVDLEAEDYRAPDGTRITQDVADEIVQRALTQSRARRGRPSLTGQGSISPRVNARVPQQLKAALAQRAQAEGVREGVVVRKALEEYLTAR